jgi:hypothetical protein
MSVDATDLLLMLRDIGSDDVSVLTPAEKWLPWNKAI